MGNLLETEGFFAEGLEGAEGFCGEASGFFFLIFSSPRMAG